MKQFSGRWEIWVAKNYHYNNDNEICLSDDGRYKIVLFMNTSIIKYEKLYSKKRVSIDQTYISDFP